MWIRIFLVIMRWKKDHVSSAPQHFTLYLNARHNCTVLHVIANRYGRIGGSRLPEKIPTIERTRPVLRNDGALTIPAIGEPIGQTIPSMSRRIVSNRQPVTQSDEKKRDCKERTLKSG